LDVAKRSFDAALLLDNGRYRHRQFTNSPTGFTQLAAWLRQHATGLVHAGLEATGTYGNALALFLHQQGLRVSVINPTRIHAFAQSELSRNKTDPLDAALIARFVATQQPPPWTPPPPEQRQLQVLVRRVEDAPSHAPTRTQPLGSGSRRQLAGRFLARAPRSFGRTIALPPTTPTPTRPHPSLVATPKRSVAEHPRHR
jgi:hypothetical protein